MRPQVPRQIPLYNRADWDGLKTHLADFHTELSRSGKLTKLSVSALWNTFSTTLSTAVSKFMPTKTASHKNKLPWIKADLKRLYRKRDKLYRKYKSTGHNKTKYLDMKHHCRKQTKIAYEKYLEDILNINTNINQNTTETNNKPNNKKLYSLLKHSKQDSTGIAPLKKTLRYMKKIQTKQIF